MWKPTQNLPVEPKNLMRFSLLLAVVLMGLWFVITLSSNPAKDRQEIVDTSRLEFIERQSDTGSPEDSRTSSDRGYGTKGILGAFLLMLVLVGAGFWVYNRNQFAGVAAKSSADIIENIALGTNHQLTILSINNEIWVLGVTGGQITLLHRYQLSEWVGTKPDISKKMATEQSSSVFADLIHKKGFKLK